MCFNYKVSLLTFVIGTVGSIVLIKYGALQYKLENTIFGTFLVFIAGIQLMEFLFWIDLKNTMGINRLTTIIGPILNAGQPIILYLIKLFLAKPDILSRYNLPFAVLNASYFIYLIARYISFISDGNLITTSTKSGGLNWPWLKYYSPYFYLILFAINIFYLTDFKYSLVFFTITYSLLYLSFRYFSNQVGEMWCFFGSFIPLLMIGAAKILSQKISPSG